MKTKLYSLLILCLLQISWLNAQTTCSDFETGTQGWVGNFASTAIASPAMDGSNFLQLTDLASQNQISCGFNNQSYPTDWNSCCGTLCFDYKIFNEGNAGVSTQLNPRITIFQGATPTTNSLRATFIGSATITENSDWVRVCAPVHPTMFNTLPSNSEGQWSMSNPAQWNSLISNVGGIYFATDIAGSPLQTEVIGVDNVCLNLSDTKILANGDDITNSNFYKLECGKECIDFDIECLDNLNVSLVNDFPGMTFIDNVLCLPDNWLHPTEPIAFPALEVLITGENCYGPYSKVINIGVETDCCGAEIQYYNSTECLYSFWLYSEVMEPECIIWQVDGKTVDSPYFLTLEDGTHEICAYYLGKNYRNQDFLCACQKECITIEVDRPDFCFEIPSEICQGDPVVVDFSCSEIQEVDSYRININNSAWENVWWQDFSGPFTMYDLTQFYNFAVGETYTVSVDFRYDCAGNVVTIQHDIEIVCCDDFCFDVPETVCYGDPIIVDFSCSNTSQLSSYRININDSNWENVWWQDFSGPLTNHVLSNYFNFNLGESYTVSVDFRYACDGTVMTIYLPTKVVCCYEYCFSLPPYLCINEPYVVDFSCSSNSDNLGSYRININSQGENVWFQDFPAPLTNLDLNSVFNFQQNEEYTVSIDFRYDCDGQVVNIWGQTLPAHLCDFFSGDAPEGKVSKKEKNKFTVYPNPSDGNYEIEHQGLKIEGQDEFIFSIRDAQGKVIKEKVSRQAHAKSDLDLTGLPAGVYFIQLEIGEEVIVKKLIKT